MATGPEEIRQHIRIYLMVFASLAVLTVVTVAASYLNVALPLGIAIALLIASVKATLVACYFMHLISERKSIYALLILSLVFLLVMLVVPLLTNSDMLQSKYVS